MGFDDNRNGQLDVAEIDASEFVCNGAPGATSLVSVSAEPAGPNCASGGIFFEYGIDDDADGILDAAEIDGSKYVCNGTQVPRPNPTPLIFDGEVARVPGVLESGDYVAANGGRVDFFTLTMSAAGYVRAATGVEGVGAYLFTAGCLGKPGLADWGSCYVGEPLTFFTVTAGDYVVAVMGDGTRPWDTVAYQLEVRRHFPIGAAGVLDTSFDSDGIACTLVGSGDSWTAIVRFQDDGKILVAGTGFFGSDPAPPGGALVRFGVDGTLDSTFNGTGIVLGVGPPSPDALAVQGDGKILLAADNTIGRLETNGAPDWTFAPSDPIVIGSPYWIGDLTLDGSGRIIVAGTQTTATQYGVLMRLGPSGAFDSLFNSDGWTLTSFGAADVAMRLVTVLGDGRILASGSTYDGAIHSAFLVRFNSDGTQDTTFGADGVAWLGTGWAEEFAAQADGGTLVVIGAGNEVAGWEARITRIDPTGAIDTSYGVAGSAELPVSNSFPPGSSLGRMKFAPGNRVLVSGARTVTGTPTAVVAAYSLSGYADPGFGNRGELAVPEYDMAPLGLAVSAFGEIALGLSGPKGFCVARLR